MIHAGQTWCGTVSVADRQLPASARPSENSTAIYTSAIAAGQTKNAAVLSVAARTSTAGTPYGNVSPEERVARQGRS